jgi:hypothetical protein
VTEADHAPEPGSAAAPATIQTATNAWFIEPRDRIRVLVPFLLCHLVIPAANLLLVQSIVTSGAAGAGLGFLFMIFSFFWGAVTSGVQALILRRHVPAAAWFWCTAGTIVAFGILDTMLSSLVLPSLRIDPPTYYRFALPVLRWLAIASAQWLILDRLVRPAGLWIAATVFAVAAYVVLQNALLTAGFRGVVMLPWGGLAVGGAQCWCLLQFRRRDAAAPAANTPV